MTKISRQTHKRLFLLALSFQHFFSPATFRIVHTYLEKKKTYIKSSQLHTLQSRAHTHTSYPDSSKAYVQESRYSLFLDLGYRLTAGYPCFSHFPGFQI